ncbi:MAG TPA: NUDIX domain-containing protein [Usitatibacter sp.]|nr:NUDIX domain-containing protein [Usitatibacter sp.]
MPKAQRSAGILLYRRREGRVEVLLVHPGGPYWKDRDAGAWSIPKGEIAEGEDPLAAARREFGEETGLPVEGRFTPLAPRRQPSGKTVLAWAVEGDCDARAVRSNLFAMEWPPRSGRTAQFPEVDRAAWFALAEARAKLVSGQRPFLDELGAMLESARGTPDEASRS